MQVRRTTLVFGCALIATAACGRAPEPEAPAPAEPTPAAVRQLDSPGVRWAVEPVPVPSSFADAVDAGTRSAEGEQGPRYWQQRVDYRVMAELDPESARLRGEEVITYHNRSPDTLGVLIFHLYQNLFREGVQRTRQVPVTGGMTLERVAAGGREARALEPGERPGPAEPVYQVDQTLMGLRLPAPLAPGDSTQIEIAWSFTVPPAGAPRTGHIDNALFNVAQWYPQVATYDDVRGWDDWPYLGNGEFYLEYGDFDVSITVPEGWPVAATGELRNPDAVLSEQTRQRLALALESDTVVRVITEEDLAPGAATQQSPDGQLTWTFRADDVRDFAFATAERYLWDAVRARVPGDEGERAVAVHALYRPQARSWREAARYTRHALEFHAERWHPYIYPQMTSVEGPVGGMEYPMIVFVAAFPQPERLYSVINHEVAHMWWPMMVGSNEHESAWQDEGLATYIENLATEDFFPETDAWETDLQRYLSLAGSEVETPIARPADLFPRYFAFATASYSKTAVLLRALGAVIGERTLHDALRAYADRWTLRHPLPPDFFNTVEDVAGRDLDWFWHPWWYEAATLDQAIVDVRVEPADGGERVTVTVADEGTAPMPVDLVFVTADGEAERVVVPVDVWLAGARRHTVEAVELEGSVRRVVIDPESEFPDVDREDNVWERAGSGSGSGSASGSGERSRAGSG